MFPIRSEHTWGSKQQMLQNYCSVIGSPVADKPGPPNWWHFRLAISGFTNSWGVKTGRTQGGRSSLFRVIFAAAFPTTIGALVNWSHSSFTALSYDKQEKTHPPTLGSEGLGCNPKFPWQTHPTSGKPVRLPGHPPVPIYYLAVDWLTRPKVPIGTRGSDWDVPLYVLSLLLALQYLWFGEQLNRRRDSWRPLRRRAGWPTERTGCCNIKFKLLIL
jgi:hypothetical protein